MVFVAVAQICFYTVITIPKLQHRSGQDQISVADIPLEAPSIGNDIVSDRTIRKSNKVKRENHAFAESIADAESADHAWLTKVFAPPLCKSRTDKSISVARVQFYLSVFDNAHSGLSLVFVVNKYVITLELRNAILNDYNPFWCRNGD